MEGINEFVNRTYVGSALILIAAALWFHILRRELRKKR